MNRVYPVPSGVRRRRLIQAAMGIAASLAFLFGLWVWFGWRIGVDQGEFVILLKKTGSDLTNDRILAPTPGHKGVQLEVLQEGRHFRNPLVWQWTSPREALDIPEGKVGILVRNFGDPLPAGEVVARSGSQRGIVAEPLRPGRYYVEANTVAYQVMVRDAVQIDAGHVGVQTSRSGGPPSEPNAFVVKKGERGIQPDLLPPGTHYLNPYVVEVTPFDVRSHKFEMSGPYRILFPSSDGFDITVEGTCEWAIERARVPEVFVKYVDRTDLIRSGGIENIQRKLILPYARSFCRIVGSRHPAVDFISGETRSAFQDQLFNELAKACAKEGIVIRSVVIRNTQPPEAIRAQHQMREIAKRERDQFLEEIKREESRVAQQLQELAKDRQSKLGSVRQEVALIVRKAEENRAVLLTEANQRLMVARTQLEAAKKQAEALRSVGLAEAAVQVMNNTAEASGIRAEVEAFGGGEAFAHYKLLSKFAPAIHGILSHTEGPFADLFQRFIAPPMSQPAPANSDPKKKEASRDL